jgi:hypothetical protein
MHWETLIMSAVMLLSCSSKADAKTSAFAVRANAGKLTSRGRKAVF